MTTVINLLIYCTQLYGVLYLYFLGNSEKLVQMLICHPNINVNLRGSDGFTALIKACGQEKLSFIIMILSHPHTNVNLSTYYGETALTHAIRYLNLIVNLDISIIIHNFDEYHCNTYLAK